MSSEVGNIKSYAEQSVATGNLLKVISFTCLNHHMANLVAIGTRWNVDK